ncbi:ABC transporter substrate-binding protein [Granulosicoccus sp. 3-233]|uniref:ABC transporter substrate-binding protein n=1 Tax=Granulosicoccus sp. 3-233 TaxID=3417969 RepID=UPI003D343C4E
MSNHTNEDRRPLAGRRLLMSTMAMGTLLLSSLATAAEAPITIVINQSPWFPGFQSVVEKYVEETGNEVELDVNPFAGSLEKQRTAVRTEQSPFDLLIMNAGFFVEFYKGGFMQPLTDIDADFALSPDIYTFDDSPYWDADKGLISAESGELYSVPVNPNIPLLHYREDLYEEHGLSVPATWDELLANARVLNDPPKRYGISQRGQRGAFDVTYDVLPYIWSHGGALFADQKGGDFTVTINSPETFAGMQTYLKLASEVGHPSTAGQTQTNVIQNMSTGRAGHILAVLSPGLFDDPTKSAVVDQVGYAAPPATADYPSSPPLGHWLAGVPRNIPDAEKKAALAFLSWFQTDDAQIAYARAGSAPVSRAVLESDLAQERGFRWMKAMADAIPTAKLTFVIPEASQVLAVTELRFNQAISGELELKEALNMAASEIHELMVAAGYEAPQLDDL